MRVTDNMRQTSLVQKLNQLTSAQNDAAERAMSGRQVNKPSDDPAAAAELARIRVSQGRADASIKATQAARSDLEISEGALAQAGDVFASAHEIAMQGANATMDANGRAMLARQVTELKQQLVGIANSKGSSGYLFAGSQIATTPFDSAGAFSGDDVAHQVDLGNGVPTAVNASGAKAFTAAGGRNVFADLDALVTALNANDQAGVAATLDTLEASRKQITTVQADAGMRIQYLQTTEDVLGQAKLALAKRDNDAAGTDTYKAYSDLVTLGQSLQQAVGVAQKLLNNGGIVQF